jgi:hypothetical protein
MCLLRGADVTAACRAQLCHLSVIMNVAVVYLGRLLV